MRCVTTHYTRLRLSVRENSSAFTIKVGSQARYQCKSGAAEFEADWHPHIGGFHILKMQWNRIAGILVSLVSLVLSLMAAGILCAYLTEYGEKRIILAAFIAAFGVGVGVVAYLFVSRHCKSSRSAMIVIAILVVLLLSPLASMTYPGRVIYSRFGLTVYGIIPVPVLDITVGPRVCL